MSAPSSPISAVIVIAATILMPPLGLFLIEGINISFWICLLLTILGYLPGHLYAFYVEYMYYNSKGIGGGGRKEL